MSRSPPGGLHEGSLAALINAHYLQGDETRGDPGPAARPAGPGPAGAGGQGGGGELVLLRHPGQDITVRARRGKQEQEGGPVFQVRSSCGHIF